MQTNIIAKSFLHLMSSWSGWRRLTCVASIFLLSVNAAIAQTQSAQTTQTTSSQAAVAVPKLYGRIEELYTTNGAKLPLPMEKMAPIRDTSLDANLQSGISTQSYPIDFRGTWTGDLVVIANKFDKAFWEFDPAEAETQKDLLKVGTTGRCTVSFDKGRDGSIALAPCHILFTSPIPESDQKRYYALHLGDLNTGWGVTGNELSCELKKNSIKAPTESVVEQEIVTHDTDRNPHTKKARTGYTENVLRFTRVNPTHLYLQAASVSYDSDGKFQNKVILNGTLSRTSSAGPPD